MMALARANRPGSAQDLPLLVNVRSGHKLASAGLDHRPRGGRGGLQVELQPDDARAERERLVLAPPAPANLPRSGRQVECLPVPVERRCSFREANPRGRLVQGHCLVRGAAARKAARSVGPIFSMGNHPISCWLLR